MAETSVKSSFYFKGDDVFISSELVKPELYLRCERCIDDELPFEIPEN